MARGLEDVSNLTNAEFHLFGPRMYALYRHVEIAYEQHQKNLLDKEVLDKSLKVLALYHESPGAQSWFDGHGALMLSEAFYQYVKSQLGKETNASNSS